MLFWMTSKTFRDVFVINEEDNDILETQYVVVSTRIIPKGKNENIINARNLLFPDPNVAMALDDDEFRYRYIKQLESQNAFFATLIRGSIDEKYNIVFICTKSENKMKYLKYLSEYIYMTFGYPCYEYKNYANGATPLIKYNKDKVLNICDKSLVKAQENDRKNKLKTKAGRKEIMKDYKHLNKKYLKEILVERNLYSPNMSKKDMLEMIEVFM